MKKRLLLSVVVAAALNLSLNAEGLHDSVVKAEQKALQNPASIKDEAAAKAAVEEASEKLEFTTKMDMAKFHKEALGDEAKRLNSVINREVAYQQKNFKKAAKEIVTGMQKTLEAINALQRNKVEIAEKALKKATEAFDVALKADPNLKLLPVDQVIEIAAVDSPLDEIKKAVDLSVKLLKKHAVQDAKAILSPLSDEIDVETVAIPMDLYPLATKTAYEALKKGDKKDALIALMEGASTVVHTRVVIPLGLLMAQDLVIAASKLDKSKKREAIELLDAAREELQKSRLLGYVSKHDKEYKALESQIEALKKEIKGKNAVEKLYDRIKADFASLVSKSRKESMAVGTPAQRAAQEKVLKFEQSEQKKALKERKQFLHDALKDAQQANR